MANKQHKSLGRGMDALFADIDNFDEKKATETVVEIALPDIRPNPYQPRKMFDQTALNELADSIKKNGVFQPIIVRQSINGYEIIAGERRFRASKLANKTMIPAIVREADETLMLEVAVLENLQREDLTPIEEAEAYATLMKKLKLTQAQVAARLGKSRPYIANYLRLQTLPTEVKLLLQDQKLSMGQARTLLGLHDKHKMVALAKRTVKESLTVRQLEKIVNELNAEKPATKVALEKSPYLRASETRLQDKFGTKVNIAAHGEKGKIEIGYLSTDDLNRILEILGVIDD
ncbi:chromosome partitioning protein ParB [Loigolactobacillus backii]|uniref:ParB/RepB/Spo0J family partition protein n=1 Tax=Loigolactobacillus backii TaxID=375175 RepID=UPI000C1C922A|nr:ParB/RepB/Spo0J family partition protein [Loigolactobacillus backii]PIO82526.1 chromosome partitioning protein ParB [Loigolactobacillus backii]